MFHNIKTFVTQFDERKTIQETFVELDKMVASLGKIQVHSINDTIHNSEPPATPHSGEYGYRMFPGEAAVVRIVVFTQE